MQRFKDILVVYQNVVGDEATISRATALAKRNRARLTVTEVLKELDTEIRDKVIEERRLHLERLITSVRLEGIDARATILLGTPFLEITRQVLRDRHDLVMMTADGPFGLKNVIFGSTSMHLMRKCPCPVWVTKEEPGNYVGILAAVDSALPTAKNGHVNKTILDLATSLARLEDSELHVVHAWELSGNDLDTSRSEITEDMLNDLIRRNEEPHKRRLEELLAEYDLGASGQPHEIHLLRGEPDLVISDLARQKAVELIVMGTICRTGVPGFFIGNTAENVLRQVDCAVMTVKPPGFQTPVTDERGVPIQAWPIVTEQ